MNNNKYPARARVAIISSTLNPMKAHWYGVSQWGQIDTDCRLRQTLGTVESLASAGLKEIILADNSPDLDDSQISILRSAGCKVLHFPDVSTNTSNKGLMELRLLTKAVRQALPKGAIVKISGRYRINPDSPLLFPIAEDFAGLYNEPRRNVFTISTRAYLVRDAEMLLRILSEVQKEVWRAKYLFGSIHLVNRSLFSFFDDARCYVKNIPLDTRISIEEGFGRLANKRRFDMKRVDRLSISGVLAATGESINE